MASQTVSHQGAELYVETHVSEDGLPVLLLHGGIGNADDWVAKVPALVDAGFRVVATDCRARARSTWGDEPLSFELMTADALAVLDVLGIARVDLVGWCDGAIIGLDMAILHRTRLRKLVLYAIAPHFPDDELRGISTPTQVLDGGEEELIQPEEPRRMAALIPGAELIIMPGTGHFAPFEEPGQVNTVVQKFLMA